VHHKPTVTDSDLLRLKDERDRADRLYNEALTALDQALPPPRVLPPAALNPETSQLDRLNRLWQIVPPDPVPFTGWRARLGAFVWRIAGPLLQRQQEFNAVLVEHVNRSTARAHESTEAAEAFAAALGDQLQALTRLHSRLIGYLQQVTLYVDTKDRYEAGLLWHELRLRTEGLAAGLSALGDQLLQRREHVLTSDRRFETRIAELKARLVEIERMAVDRPTAVQSGAGQSPVATAAGGAGPRATAARDQMSGDEEALTYAGFEDLYRGPVDEITDRVGEYVPLFTGADGEVIDLGCGRGEFLVALREHRIAGRGVDINPTMVERCRSLGLDVVQAEALSFLAALPDRSTGGIFAAQVVEHLAPHELLHLIDLARAKLRPGGRIVLETVNPACWAAFFSSYIRDITHVRPIHPDTLRYLLVARQFEDVEIRYSSPYPVEARLHRLPLTLTAEGEALDSVVKEFNRNVDILNGQMFTYLDYAAVATAR
jgi:SAM-dependent methyltransferase